MQSCTPYLIAIFTEFGRSELWEISAFPLFDLNVFLHRVRFSDIRQFFREIILKACISCPHNIIYPSYILLYIDLTVILRCIDK